MKEYLSKIESLINVENLTAWLLASGLRIILIFVISYILLKVIKTAISRIEKTALKDQSEFSPNLELERRVFTIGNLLRKVASIMVFLIASMMILKELGLNITPIITGAGIIGLAVGFGAQSLVKDIISGFFILLENQIRVGDSAVINGVGGTVEKINLRTIILRDIEGSVHVFSNGSINALANRSKGWSRYVIDLGVAYKEDVDKVMEVLNNIGKELESDDYFENLILEPLDILGVDKFGSSEVVIKCMIKTEPLKQWEVGRELRRRIKLKFDELNIEIPYPHMSVYFGEASKAFEHKVRVVDEQVVRD